MPAGRPIFGQRAIVADIDGRLVRFNEPDTMGMLAPVRCRCGQVFDMADVHVEARYADCSTFKTPCCGVLTDDRPWTGFLVRLDRR